MILYIAEKPSLGRAIADVLPKPHKKAEGCVIAANGDVVSWCIGHLLEQCDPDAYDERYKKWREEDLPIVPDQWQLTPKKETRKQLTVLRKLIKEADQLVHAGDPDREGQLLVDEVISYLKVPAQKRNAMLRCLISDLNPQAVKSALAKLRSNRDFIPLSTSALARSRADWLYGMNMTRLCTLRGQQSGYQGVLSVGRVQTPLLGLVVHRDLEIENFVSKPFYEVYITLETGKGELYRAKWKPSEACADYMDDEGRVLSKKLAENVVARVKHKPGIVVEVKNANKKQPAPLPYNLSSLQIDAAKRFGVSAKQVLDACQQLYERHKLITYPRSDCRYLPLEHWKNATQVVSAINRSCDSLAQAVSGADTSIKSKAWNDSKVSAHHAIIPTAKVQDVSKLTKSEAQVYELIARQYLMQFYPPFEYAEKQIDTEVMGGLFIAKQKDTLAEGWKILLPKRTRSESSPTGQGVDTVDGEPTLGRLPTVLKGDAVHCQQADVHEKQTSPPKYFTDATLLSAMTGIARYVSDTAIRKVLRETDGLGTEATRAGIIELLFKRGFLTRVAKDIRATEVGRQLIISLPDAVSYPDMTAHWESQLTAISQRELNYAGFLEPMTNGLENLLAQVKGVTFHGLAGKGKAPYKAKARRKSRVKKPASKA